MDLLTPAHKWAIAERAADVPVDSQSNQPEDAGSNRMPLPQQATMFISVVGPIVGLIAAIAILWHRGAGGVGWTEIVAMLAMYALAGFGVTIGYHRLLTHRAFETYRPIRLFLAICGSVAAQGAVIRWCATHRRHHQAADHEGDPHSPHLHGTRARDLLRGMWHAHMGWLFLRDVPDSAQSVAEMVNDPAMLLIDRLYFFWVFTGIALPGIVLGLLTGTWHGFFNGIIWGGLVRICLMQHATWSINSVCHVWGRRPFRTSDQSANNWMCALFALGEGWHNNHHAFPTSARQGLRWWQFDSSWLIILAMASIGLIWNIRTPSPTAISSKASL